jgi:hypothetical protein
MSITLAEKGELILRYEQRFAYQIASQLFIKPKPGIWMILIPVFLVYFLFDLQRCKNNRENFVENYLLTKNRVLDESMNLIETGGKADIESLVSKSGLPESARNEFVELLVVLFEHYNSLLRAYGDEYELLVRNAYKNQKEYIHHIKLLNTAENRLNIALSPGVEGDETEVADAIRNIEKISTDIRRKDAERFFPE